MAIKTYKTIETIVLYFVTEKNLEISFQNGPEHETTSLNMYLWINVLVRNSFNAPDVSELVFPLGNFLDFLLYPIGSLLQLLQPVIVLQIVRQNYTKTAYTKLS